MSYELTQDILKELLHYDSETGIFTWNKRDLKWFTHCEQPNNRCSWWNNKFAGKKAGNVFTKENELSYTQIGMTINGSRRNLRATQLAWLYMTGHLPDKAILRKDNNTLNDKWDNLILDKSDGTKNNTIELTYDIIRELTEYNTETGIMVWKPRNIKYFSHCYDPNTAMKLWNNKFANKDVGSKRQTVDGRWYYSCKISLKGEIKTYNVHRLIWFYMNGEMPNNLQIDHIDHNGLNNKWNNLRKVTHTENQQNSSRRKDNISGITGVHYDDINNKWIATINANKKRQRKNFKDFEDAVKQRQIWNIEYGFHENHGKMNSEIISD